MLTWDRASKLMTCVQTVGVIVAVVALIFQYVDFRRQTPVQESTAVLNAWQIWSSNKNAETERGQSDSLLMLVAGNKSLAFQDASGGNFRNLILPIEKMPAADVSHSNYCQTDFKGSVVGNADFSYSVFGSRKVDGKNRWTNFEDVKADGANFEGAFLKGTFIDGSSFKKSNFTSADLRGAFASGTNFREADFTNADLRGISLNSFTIKNKNKIESPPSDFTGASFVNTDLRGVDLSNSKGITTIQIAEACTDSTTKLPPGIKMPQECIVVPDNRLKRAHDKSIFGFAYMDIGEDGYGKEMYKLVSACGLKDGEQLPPILGYSPKTH